MDANFWVSIVSIAVLLAFASVAAAAGRWAEYLSRRMLILKRKAYAFYVETGTKTEAFSTLSRRAIKAAERERLATLRERQRQRNGEPFTAECGCPSCGRVAVHWMEFFGPGRECLFCGYKWRQE